ALHGALDRRLRIVAVEVGHTHLAGDGLQLLLVDPRDAGLAGLVGDVLPVGVAAAGSHLAALRGAVAQHRAAVDQRSGLAEGLGLALVGVLTVGQEIDQDVGIGVVAAGLGQRGQQSGQRAIHVRALGVGGGFGLEG